LEVTGEKAHREVGIWNLSPCPKLNDMVQGFWENRRLKGTRVTG